MDFLSSALKFVTHRDFWFTGGAAAGVIFLAMILIVGEFGFWTGVLACGGGGAAIGAVYRAIGMTRKNH